MGSSEEELANLIAAALTRIRGRGPRRPEHFGHHAEPPHEHRADWHARRDMRGGVGGPARMRMLEVLAGASGGLSIGDIAAAVGVDQPRASRLVQQAQQHGFVLREADPADARRSRIRLTAIGERFASGARGERLDAVRKALDGFSEEERAEFARLLAKFAANWPSPHRPHGEVPGR